MSLVDNNRFLEAPAYWRREDVLRLWQGRDDESKRRLTKFRPFNAQFLVEHSIRLPSFANSSSESMEHWQWSLPIEEEDVCVIASKHMRESLELFPLISFREWVREALELSPTTIWCFRGKIRSLSWVVFSYLAPRPEVGPEYLTSISPGQIDPFTRAAIENACNCVRSGQYSESDLVLGFQFITEPLKKLLYQPSSVHDILQQLEVLEVRFKNWYHSSEDWPGRFDIETPFLKDLSHSSPTSLALRMSKEDHLQFQDLNRRRLKALDNSQLFSPINSWWNDRCRVAQECSAAGDKITSKLVKLVRAFSDMRNYFSMTAVLHGLTLGCFYSPQLDDLYELVNRDNNYQRYKDMMSDGKSALHFLFPAQTDIQLHDDSSGLVLVLDASERYWGLRAFVASYIYDRALWTRKGSV